MSNSSKCLHAAIRAKNEKFSALWMRHFTATLAKEIVETPPFISKEEKFYDL